MAESTKHCLKSARLPKYIEVYIRLCIIYLHIVPTKGWDIDKKVSEKRGEKMRGPESRSRWEIILDILKVTSEGEGRAKKTRIMQYAYLDWRNFQRHFGVLQENEFIADHKDPKEGTSYYLTEKGIDLMGRLNAVQKMLR